MMKKKLFLAFLSIAFILKIDAQTLPRTYVISADTATQQFLDNNYWQVLNDKSSSFTIDDVQKEPLAGQFAYFTRDSKNHFTKTTWFRFNLKNNAGKPLQISIASEDAEADFYIPDSGGIMHHYITGWAIGWDKKNGFKKNNAIPFEIMQGQQMMVYLKTLNYSAFLSDDFTFSIFNTEKLVNMKHHQYKLEPNVHFSPDGKWVIFRANFEGESNVYAVEIKKSAE